MNSKPYHEFVLSDLQLADSYHLHKENIAFGAAGLYLAGVGAIVISGGSFLPRQAAHPVLFNMFIVLMAALAGTAFIFIYDQFRKKEYAADWYNASRILAVRWLTAEPTPEELRPSTRDVMTRAVAPTHEDVETIEGLDPVALRTLQQHLASQRTWCPPRGPRHAEACIYTAMVLLTICAVFRIWIGA